MSSRFTITGFALVALTALGSILFIRMLLPPQLPVPEPAGHVLTNVTVWTPGAAPLPHHTVVVENGRIAAVRPTTAEDPAPVCDACFVMPGLTDAHVHTPPSFVLGNQDLFALLYLAHGVTSVRDLGQSDESIATLAERLTAHDLPGPHFYRCGPVLDGDPPGWPVARLIRTDREARSAVQEIARSGADCIKIYNEVSEAAYHAAAEEARVVGLPVIGHIPHAVGLTGVRDFEAQHFTGVPYLSRPRPPLGTDIGDADLAVLTGGDISDALDLARENRVSFTPTLANFSLRLTSSRPDQYPPTEATRHMPRFWMDYWPLVAGAPETDTEIALRVHARRTLHEITRMAHSKGIDVLAGTDTLMPWVVPGESLWLELRELALVLGSEEQALRAATDVNGAHIAPGEIGRVAVGYRADLLLLSADPRQNLEALERWRFVMREGRLYSRTAVDDMLARYDRHFHSPIYDWVMSTLIGLVIDQFSASAG